MTRAEWLRIQRVAREHRIAMYRAGLSCREIGKLVGVGPDTIRQQLVRSGEPRRGRGRARRDRSEIHCASPPS